MKLIIDIPEEYYDALKRVDEIISGKRNCKTLESVVYDAIGKGTPLTECEDIISRQAVEEIKEIMTDISGNSIYAVRMSDIRALPPVQPKAKTGKWMDVSDGFTEHFGQIYRCSECGDTSIGKQDYCKDCGADMRGEK